MKTNGIGYNTSLIKLHQLPNDVWCKREHLTTIWTLTWVHVKRNFIDNKTCNN
jgi:hypothetical protein